MAGPILTWDTQADWDAAQSRARVVSRDVGTRVPDQLWQGYDPNYAPLTDAVAYWPCDDGFGDEIGTANGVASGPTAGHAGILSSNSYRFDGLDDIVEVDAMPLADPGSSWTVNLWVYLTSKMSYRLYFSLEDSVAGESLGIGNWNNGTTKIYSAGRTPGTGSDMTLGTWTMMTLRWDADTQTATLFKNGSFDYDVAPSGGGSVFANADQLTLGNRRVGANSPTEGRLNEFILFDRALTNAEIQSLYDTATSGTLTTATQAGETEAVELTTTAAVPSGASATITVNQYDGTTSNTETVSLSNGTQVHTLSNFEALSGATYWLDITEETTSVEASTQLDTASLQLADAATTPSSETLVWQGESEWEAATDRNGVTTTDRGDRVGNELGLGYHDDEEPIFSADAYWHFDEDSGTHQEIMNGRTATRSGATAGVEGLLDTSAISFDGSNDYAAVGNNAVFNNLTELTWVMWVKTNTSSSSGYNDLVGKGDFKNTTSGSFLLELDDNKLTLYVGSYVRYDAAPAQSFSGDEWHHVAATWKETEGGRLYIDGERVASGTGTQRHMPSNSSALTFGADLPFDSFFDGVIDEPMFFRRRLSDSTIQKLYRSSESGWLTTQPQTSDGAAQTISTTAKIPTGGAINATVYQDMTGDGMADHSQTVSVPDGAATKQLASFESVAGSTYWVRFDLSTNDPTVTPKVTSAAVTTDTMTQLFVSTVDLGGRLVDIPLYDPTTMDRTPVRMRDDITGEVGAANVVDASDATALVRHPTDGLIGIEAYTRGS